MAKWGEYHSQHSNRSAEKWSVRTPEDKEPCARGGSRRDGGYRGVRISGRPRSQWMWLPRDTASRLQHTASLCKCALAWHLVQGISLREWYVKKDKRSQYQEEFPARDPLVPSSAAGVPVILLRAWVREPFLGAQVGSMLCSRTSWHPEPGWEGN